MKPLLKRIRRFFHRDSGPTAVETAMMWLLILLACLTAVTVYGQATAQSLSQSRTLLEQVLGR